MTQISSKFAALAIALMMNSVILGGVALLFSSPTQHAVSALAAASPVEAIRQA